MTAPRAVHFSELRGDWYRGADLMARLIQRSAHGGMILLGFPANWIPIFVHFGAAWRDAIEPPQSGPLFSDLSVAEIERLARAALARGQSRSLVESAAALDPLLADVLHLLDRRRDVASPETGTVALTGWQSYGRPEVLDLEDRILARPPTPSASAVLLPCARRRPYRLSKTHKRLWRGLDGMGIRQELADEIVISSLGVIPAPFWEDPIVLAYDSGVPDIYRVLRLMRAFFTPRPYERVVDCLEFEPYRDCLRIIAREGIVGRVLDGPARRIRKLPRP